MIARAAWLFLVIVSINLCAAPAQAIDFLINFETEDDFATPLIHGQSVYSTARPNNPTPFVPFSTDTRLEFGRLIRISSTVIGNDDNLGPAIFDTDPGDAPPTGDPDLVVGLGNALMIQRDENPGTTLHPTRGLIFNTPNDEADFQDRGSIVIDFLINDVHLKSLDLIDIDGGSEVEVILTDLLGRERIYSVPTNWTTDITVATKGYHTLRLETLLNQPSEPNATGGDATAVEDRGFNDQSVIRLEVQFLGSLPSGALDNLRFSNTLIPEPSAFMLALAAGAGSLSPWGRRMFRCKR